MNKEQIQSLINKYKNWSFTIVNVNIIHDKCKLVGYDDDLIILSKNGERFAVHYSVILNIEPNFKMLDIVLLIGIMR